MLRMIVLIVDLKNGTIEEKEWDKDYFGLRCALSLYNEFGKDSLIMSAFEAKEYVEGSVTPWHFVWYSEITKKMEFSTNNHPHGYSLYKLGISALVILGRAEKLRTIMLSQSKREIISVENMRGETSLSFEKILADTSDLSLSTSIAGDKGVYYSSVQYRGNNISALGLARAFFSHNLKAITMPYFPQTTQTNDTTDRLPQKNMEKSRFFRFFRTYGGYSFIDSALSLGWAPIFYYSKRFDPRAYSLDGCSMADKYGNYPEGCLGCLFSCSRRTKDGRSLPSWKELLLLGPNLGFFDPDNILKLYEKCLYFGLDIPQTSAILSFMLYGATEETRRMYSFEYSGLDSLLKYIEKLASGSLLSDGLISLSGAIESYDHRAIEYDLRGAKAEALLYAMGLPLVLPSILFFPKKEVSDEVSAIFALYETIYTLALLSLGHPPFLSSLAYWSKVPQLAFKSPFLARWYCHRYNAFGHSSDELLVKGMEIYEALNLSWHPIPSHFIMDSRSSLGTTTVDLKKLEDYYDEEKLHLLIRLKSINDKIAKNEGVNMPNVGPS